MSAQVALVAGVPASVRTVGARGWSSGVSQRLWGLDGACRVPGLGARSGPRAARDGVSYDAVPIEYLKLPSPVQEALGPRRPSGWVLAKAGGRGPGRGGVVHAVDCEEAPAGAPVLTLERALGAAQHPGTRLCSLCGAAAELAPILKGFDGGFNGED
ncbi:hypothetical protein GCM10010406_41110 [Streptomyces thermolineatus]|uniref:Uncharacterized protein n=1 Tax=Streptomyces thermolineatus TaxID=44033 RepID=A0ABP5ZQK3_9ACTN